MKLSSRPKKGKHIALKRFVRLSKLFLLFIINDNGRSHQKDNNYSISGDTNRQNNGMRYINQMIEKLHSQFTKYSKLVQNNYDTRDCYLEDSSQNIKVSAKEVTENTEADRYSEFKTQKSVFPNLSSVQGPNFRVRLYRQLNVVGRSSKLNAHLCSAPVNSNSQSGRGNHRNILQAFERSKPIAMSKGRMIDCDGGFCDREWPLGPVSSLSRSANEDVFALDI